MSKKIVMAKNCFGNRKIILFSFLFFAGIFANVSNQLFAATETTWVIAAEKFDLKSNGIDVDSVQTVIQEMIPSRIIDNLSSSSYRTISGDEEFERTMYTLKDERISLFLQLSSAIRAKDSIFLNDYSEKKIESLKKEEDKKIKAVQDKIDENIAAQKKAAEKAEKKSGMQGKPVSQSEGQKYINLLKGLVLSEDMSFVNERVVIYEKGDSNLYSPSENAKKHGYKSHEFEKEMVTSKINSLITGQISIIGDYMAVTVEVFVYPGCKSIGTVTEVGAMNDVDFITSSIALQIAPWISASMPVVITLNLQPEEALSSLRFSIDDIVYKDFRDEYVIDSGVHSIRFDADGYRTAITSFNFEGNVVYNIDVELQAEKTGSLFIKMEKPLFGIENTDNIRDLFKKDDEPFVGSLYSNGEFEQSLDEENQIAKIKINNTLILGQFIDSENGSGFFYIPEKLLTENEYLDVSVKTFDRGERIEKRRRRMYLSYSAFVVSLLGFIFTDANRQIYSNYYYEHHDADNPQNDNIDIINTANAWITASNICMGITIGTGVLFGFELFRYFRAADSVLPAKTKKAKNKVAKNQKKPGEPQNLETEDVAVLEESVTENKEAESQGINTENADDSKEQNIESQEIQEPQE